MAHAVTIIKTPKADSMSPFDAILALLILNANDVTKAVDKAINAVMPKPRYHSMKNLCALIPSCNYLSYNSCNKEAIKRNVKIAASILSLACKISFLH